MENHQQETILSDDLSTILKTELGNDDEDSYNNVQIEIKQEINATLEASLNSMTSNMTLRQNAANVVVKEEHSIVPVASYNYMNYEDNGSLDSSNDNALANVEACLQEEVNIKFETELDDVSIPLGN